jgi:predicted ATP-grasp superfamily ATP-dependent carboligase
MLSQLCERLGVATPRTRYIDSRSELEDVRKWVEPPVVVKSTTLRNQAVAQNVVGSPVVNSIADLQNLARGWTEPYRIIIQQYIPDEVSDDWIVNGYCGADTEPKVVFTGRKERLWPRQGGSLAAGYTAMNPQLGELTAALCRQVGYRGIFDVDWRFDRRTGQYYLLDFNPRVGAQFRMFENDAGIDVVRAMHLDLSGRDIPPGSQVDGERFVVEPWDAAAIISTRRRPRWTGGSGRARLAWLAADDSRPVVATVVKQAALSIKARVPWM